MLALGNCDRLCAPLSGFFFYLPDRNALHLLNQARAQRKRPIWFQIGLYSFNRSIVLTKAVFNLESGNPVVCIRQLFRLRAFRLAINHLTSNMFVFDGCIAVNEAASLLFALCIAATDGLCHLH